MKKLLLAAAVMTTFASASAFAQFGAEKEGENTGNITIGGEISGAPFKWVSAIDSNPAGLNSKTAKTVDDWKTAQGGTGYTMDLGLTTFEPLVYVRTKGNALTNTLVPRIIMTDSDGVEHDVTEKLGETNQTSITAAVKMGSSASDLVDAPSVAAEVSVLFNYGYAYKGEGDVDLKIADNMKDPGGYIQSMLNNAGFTVSGPTGGLWESTYSWREAVAGTWGSHVTKVGYAGLAGATSAILKTTASTKPTGFWQASIPVTVAYK